MGRRPPNQYNTRYITAPRQFIIIDLMFYISIAMWRFLLTVVALVTYANGENSPRSGDELVSTVLDNCIDMDCVKHNVLSYLDNVLELKSDVRNAKNIDAAIFKRTARILQTQEFKFKVPEALLEKTEIVYNPKSGLDIVSHETEEEESRGLGLKKKLLFPVLLLLKLKMKLLMPLFVALIGLKATKALILSKLAILIVLGFIVYQFMAKSGMPMAMSMAPAEPPASLYGPAPSTAPPSSYEPGWEPNQGGPYQRVWTGNNDPQSLAYSSYYPGSSTNRP